MSDSKGDGKTPLHDDHDDDHHDLGDDGLVEDPNAHDGMDGGEGDESFDPNQPFESKFFGGSSGGNGAGGDGGDGGVDPADVHEDEIAQHGTTQHSLSFSSVTCNHCPVIVMCK
jgi:hypothetical protein